MKAYLRVLTERGQEEFNIYVMRLKGGTIEAPPINELSCKPYSEEFLPLEVDNRAFSTRLELAKYLSVLFHEVDRNSIVNKPGLWSWLALFWFDQLCPKKEDGTLNVRQAARYICSLDYRDYYRHLVAATWNVFYLHNALSRLFLYAPPHTHNDFMEQLASRQDIITNKAMIKAVDSLYWNGSGKGRPKRNATNRKKPGNLRRLISVIDQLSLTYDLQAMSADDILTLLPTEFDIWKD